MPAKLYIRLISINGSDVVHSIIITEPAKIVIVTHVDGRLEDIRHIASHDELKEELQHWEDKWDYVHMRPIFSYTFGGDTAYDIICEDDEETISE